MAHRQIATMVLVVVALVGSMATSAQAVPVFTGGNGAVSFGVTDYGLPVPGIPTYIPNNFTLLNDVLSSPGGTFLTANPVVGNNIASYAGLLPGGAVQIGGGNLNGAFGTGAISITGPKIAFGLTDPIPGGGSASYEIGSWNATFTDAAGSVGNYGTYLSIGGSLPGVGSAAAVSLITEVTSANPASPFFGGVALPELVLADSQTAPGVYSWVALGGVGGLSAAIITDPLTSTFRGLAINSFAVAIPAGDVFTVTSTLTAYADPASIDAILPDETLLDLIGPLPDIVVSSGVPEPSSILLTVIATGVLGFVRFGRRMRKR